MVKHKTRSYTKSTLFLALTAFLVASISISGLILKQDRVGQIIWSGIWTLISLFWLLGLIKSKSNTGSGNS